MNNFDYSKKGIEVEFKFLQVHFKGIVELFDPSISKYKIKVTEWLGRGYPHLIYYSDEINLIFKNKNIS